MKSTLRFIVILAAIAAPAFAENDIVTDCQPAVDILKQAIKDKHLTDIDRRFFLMKMMACNADAVFVPEKKKQVEDYQTTINRLLGELQKVTTKATK